MRKLLILMLIMLSLSSNSYGAKRYIKQQPLQKLLQVDKAPSENDSTITFRCYIRKGVWAGWVNVYDRKNNIIGKKHIVLTANDNTFIKVPITEGNRGVYHIRMTEGKKVVKEKCIVIAR